MSTKRARRIAQRIRWGARRNTRAHRLGFVFELDLRDNVQRHLYRAGHYEPELTKLLLDNMPSDGTFVDVGAHIGIHALPIARERPAGRVVAFEPTPDSARRLRDAANGLANLELVELALGSEGGTVELRADPDFGAGDAAVRSAYGHGRVVGTFPADSFDHWATRNGLTRLDVVKLDVEGLELKVLEGMRRSLERLRPSLLVVELEPYLLDRAGVQAGSVEELLADVGYSSDGRLERNVVFRREVLARTL